MIILNLIIICIVIIIIFYILNNIKIPLEHFKSKQNNLCCLYAYYEKDELYKNNLKYFLQNGLLPEVDYYIIINGICNVDIPPLDNITVIKRENKGYDFGAYSYAINNIIKQKYDYYFFMNTSVCGPYLKDNKKPWTKYFLELFQKDVKIVGTTINIFCFNKFESYNLQDIYKKDLPFTHIQSMFFCIDAEYFEYLKNINFFDEDELNSITNINKIIAYKELGLSQYALMNGWNINCILSKYKNIDYRKIKKDINPTSNNGDPYYTDGYFGKSIDKYDVIFLKNNRKIKYN